MKPVSGGTAQPDIVSMWHALKGTEYDLGLDVEKILETEEIFKECMKDYFLPPEALSVNPMIIQSPLPGGALTANTQMLRDNNLMDKYPEVVAAMKEVVEKGGFGTSVTPVSQFYFQQAFNNVMFGPWKKIAEGYGKMVLGYFGKTPCDPDADVIKIASEQLNLQPTTEKVVDINDRDPNKGIPAAKKRLEDAGLPVNDENIFISAACKEKGILFLEGKGTIGVRKCEPGDKEPKIDEANNAYTVTVNGKKYAVALEGRKATVNGKLYDFDVKAGIEAKAVAGDATPVKAALPGTVLKVLVSAGDAITEGDVIAVVEAMKMETEIKSPMSGTVKEVEIEVGDKVKTGDILVSIG